MIQTNINQNEKCWVFMEEIIPHFEGCGIFSPRRFSSDDAVHTVNRTSLSHPSVVPTYPLLLGTQRGRRHGPVSLEKVYSSLRGKTEKGLTCSTPQAGCQVTVPSVLEGATRHRRKVDELSPEPQEMDRI